MPTKRTRRKPNGVGAILTLRYPADEVPALDAAAEAKGLTRGAFMHAAIAREVRRVERNSPRPALPRAS